MWDPERRFASSRTTFTDARILLEFQNSDCAPEQRFRSVGSRTALVLRGFRTGLVGFRLQGLEQRLRTAEQRLWAPETFVGSRTGLARSRAVLANYRQALK